MKTYRQGDVLLRQIEKIPPTAAVQKRRTRSIILAYGEATGHHHAIVAPLRSVTVMFEGGEMYLEVHERVTLGHQEHAAITIESGCYRVVRQVEYTPKEIRRVID